MGIEEKQYESIVYNSKCICTVEQICKWKIEEKSDESNEKKQLAEQLNERLPMYGFKRRGEAFFRVVGDGILQVIKFEYERVDEDFNLSVGLFSMYGKLLKQWFTSLDCIPQYLAVNFVGKRYIRATGEIYDKETGVTLVYDKEFISTDEQMDILMEKVIPRLNKMQTQGDLIEEMYCLDKIKFVGEIFWLDSLKLGAFIAAGQNDNAIRVISAYLYQRLGEIVETKGWEKTYWTEEDVERYERLKLFPEDDEYFTGLFRMVKRNDKEEIRKYLTDNYECNKKYAAFCMKK